MGEETKTFPFQEIINTVNKFIIRQIRSNRTRLIVTIIVGILACCFLAYALFVILPKEGLASVATALVSLATVFIGTIGFGILNPYLTTSQHIKYAEDIKSELEGYANSPSDETTKKFIDSFFELLRTLLK